MSRLSPSAHDDPARQLSKLIAALERQRREELGGPEAAATALVMHKAHRLLTAVTAAGQLAELAPSQGLRLYLGAEWVEANPWAAGPIEKIDAALKRFFQV